MSHIVLLEGIQTPVVKVIQQGKIDKLLAQPSDVCMISIGVFKEVALEETATLLSMEGAEITSDNPADLQKVLDDYGDLFEVLIGLPPLDHMTIRMDLP